MAIKFSVLFLVIFSATCIADEEFQRSQNLGFGQGGISYGKKIFDTWLELQIDASSDSRQHQNSNFENYEYRLDLQWKRYLKFQESSWFLLNGLAYTWSRYEHYDSYIINSEIIELYTKGVDESYIYKLAIGRDFSISKKISLEARVHLLGATKRESTRRDSYFLGFGRPVLRLNYYW